MKKLSAIVLCTIALSLFAFQLFAQNNTTDFEQGTVILNDSTELDVLIKVDKWNLSPQEVTIKRTADDQPEILTLEQVKAFTIPAFIKFRRDTIQYDVSGMKHRTMLERREPFYEQRVVFLRVLIEGEVSLFSYRSPIKEQFYFQKSGEELTHLVYKRFLASPNRIAVNNRYQQQLYTEVRCGDVEISDMTKIEYEIDDLTRYFIHHNSCIGSEAVSFQRVDSQGEIKINLSAGLGFSNVIYSRPGANVINNRDVSFGTIPHIVVDGGIEWILPFDSKGWSIFGSLAYYSLSAEKEYSYGSTSTEKVTYETSVLNIMFELRRYFNSDKHNSFFGGLAMGTSTSTYEISGIEMENTDRFAKQISMGYLWNNHVFAKVTYNLPYTIDRIDLNTLTFSLGFSF